LHKLTVLVLVGKGTSDPAKESRKRLRDLMKLVTMKEKVFILLLCVLGIAGVCYGMVNKDHPVFVAGLAFVVVGYLMIRKKLKAHIRTKYQLEDERKKTRET
jgi:hypothetical protein